MRERWKGGNPGWLSKENMEDGQPQCTFNPHVCHADGKGPVGHCKELVFHPLWNGELGGFAGEQHEKFKKDPFDV